MEADADRTVPGVRTGQDGGERPLPKPLTWRQRLFNWLDSRLSRLLTGGR